ncbi:MAG: chlorophyll a/b-binding protein [Nodosilinea sp.]
MADPSPVPPTEPISPDGRSDPAPAQPHPSFGWNAYAERINGRFAMVGFIALLLLEWFTQQSFFTWLGLR